MRCWKSFNPASAPRASCFGLAAAALALIAASSCAKRRAPRPTATLAADAADPSLTGPETPPAVRRALEVAAPPCGSITRVAVDVNYLRAPSPSQRTDGDTVRYSIVLIGPRFPEAFVFEEYRGAEYSECGPASCPPLNARARAQLTAAFAPDGHALALSDDRGASYRYLALDTGESPMFCAHQRFALPRGASDWSAAPTTDRLAMDILQSSPAAGASNHHAGHGFARELRASLRYATRDESGDDMAIAAINAYRAFHDTLVDAEDAPPTLTDRLRARMHGARVEQALAAALRDPAFPSTAVLVAADARSTAVQDAIASRMSPSQRDGAVALSNADRATVAWTLGRVTTALNAASPRARSALVEAATTPDTPETHATAVFAVRALAVLRGPQIEATLRRVATPRCDTEFAVWPTAFNLSLNESTEQANDYALSCWARGALQWRRLNGSH